MTKNLWPILVFIAATALAEDKPTVPAPEPVKLTAPQFLKWDNSAQVSNIRLCTDQSPDYSDLDTLVHSITSKWPTPREKVWAMFYWNHMARCQTEPMNMHGYELADPIRQFNDYGYTQCSTISGINCAIWNHMGLKCRFFDVSAHTVAEVEYDGKYHMIDNSLSALYTLCDGKTLASCAEIGATGGCAASGGRQEPGHVGRYHCLYSTGKNGLLSGADCGRSVESEGTYIFNPNGLKPRSYYYNQDAGHRYILNMRENESYTRYWQRRDGPAVMDPQQHKSDPAYYVPNEDPNNVAKKFDPEVINPRYAIRGSGVWSFKPKLTADEFGKFIHSAKQIAPAKPQGLQPQSAGMVGEVIFKIQAANVATSQVIKASLVRKTAEDSIKMSVSTNNGLQWAEVFASTGAEKTGEIALEKTLIKEVNGAYEILIKFELLGKAAPENAVISALDVETRTEINSKTQPKLMPGKNTVYIDAGEPTESMVYWPDLRSTDYKKHVWEEKNVVSQPVPSTYTAQMWQAKPGEAYVVFRMDAPNDIVKLVYGGRLYNRQGRSEIDFLHSFDEGKTWIKAYALTDIQQPWDVIHYETVKDIPPGTRSVLFKYLMDGDGAASDARGLYAVRMEADYKVGDGAFKPLEVTYKWTELDKDRKPTERSHTQLVEKSPFKYVINVGGEELPVMNSVTIAAKGATPGVKYGYSDDKDVGGEKFIYRWRTDGTNFAEGKPYTLSLPVDNGPKNLAEKILTDGAGGSTYAGGAEPEKYGIGWRNHEGTAVEIVVDLGEAKDCGAFRIFVFAGWPWWDSLRVWENQDDIEVLTSEDGKAYTSQGKFPNKVRYIDVPINHMISDDRTAQGWNFELCLKAPVKARYVKYINNVKRWQAVSEVQVFDKIEYTPFDIRIALPDEKVEETKTSEKK